MRIALNARGGRFSRGAKPEPVEASGGVCPPVPATTDEPEPESATDRWEKLIDELEQDGGLEEPEPTVAAGAPAVGNVGALTMLQFAAQEVEAARQREMLAHATKARENQNVVSEVLAALKALVARPTGDTHITLPANEIHPHVTVHEPSITVEPAEVRSPDVNVEVAAPQVTVEAPAPAQIEVRPEIRVEAAKAPDVHVSAPDVHVTVEPPQRPNAVRLEVDDDGTKRFVVEDDEEGEE